MFNFVIMEQAEKETQTLLVGNLRKIMRDRNLTQAILAEYMGTNPSQVSRILKGGLNVTLTHISNLAQNLSLREIDIFTYPEQYTAPKKNGEEPVEAILQVKLNKAKKDQVLKLVFGDNNFEILNK